MNANSKSFLMILLPLVTPLAGCKFNFSQSTVKKIEPGRPISLKESRDPSKKQVLVYYGNNPVETSLYVSERAKILASFSEAAKMPNIKTSVLLAARSKFEKDASEFGIAVTKDVSGIRSSVCAKDARIGAGAFLISNAAVINNDIVFCNPGEIAQPIPDSESMKFARMYSRMRNNPIYEHSPLSHPEMLKAVLDTVAVLFPTSKFEYSLVLKSHGSETMTITPKVGYEARIITPKFVAEHFQKKSENSTLVSNKGLDKDGLEKDGLDKDGLDKDGLDKDGLDKDGLDKDGLDKDGLDKDGLDKDGLDKDGLDSIDHAGLAKNGKPEGAIAAGIAKGVMLAAILDPARDLFFNVVFMESCKSDIGPLMQDLADVPYPTIGYLYGSDLKGLAYTTVNWAALGSSGATSLRSWLTGVLGGAADKAK